MPLLGNSSTEGRKTTSKTRREEEVGIIMIGRRRMIGMLIKMIGIRIRDRIRIRVLLPLNLIRSRARSRVVQLNQKLLLIN